ncbi:MAG: InlB B-repeat-containing protein [Clostridia bacterium]|nr:InlB B-repeat-containing protein [Clostridia bacterium]
MKKVVSVLLVLMMLLSTLVVTASAAYENTYTNTGNQRVDIVEVAKTQIGCTDKYKYNNPNGYAWCAFFVVWCARQANIDSSIIRTSGVACADSGYLNVPYYSRTSHSPQSGDLVFFNWPSTSDSWDHVGIVEYVESNGTVHTIEGNSSNRVKRCSYSANGTSESNRLSSIRGYGVPNYLNNQPVNECTGYNIAYSYNTENNKFYDSNTVEFTITPHVNNRDAYDNEITNISLYFKKPNGEVNYIPLGKNKSVEFYMSDYDAGKYVFWAKVETIYGSSEGAEDDGSLSLDLARLSWSNFRFESDVIYARIKFKEIDRYLTVNADENAVSWERKNSTSSDQSQIWKVIRNSDGTFTIQSVQNNKVLDISKGSYCRGANVLTYTSQDSENQKWYLSKDSNNNSFIRAAKSNSAVLDVEGHSAENGTNVGLWTYHGGDAQKVVFQYPYLIQYNANGGSNPPSSQDKEYGKTLALSTTVPTRTGYTFLGWSTSSSATSASYSAGGSYTANADATLYAVWKANTYTVKYNANGGSGTMSNSSHTYNVSKALTSNAFTRSGYTFLGWSTSSSATSPTYTNGQSVKNLTSTNNGTVTLYAVWSKNPTYTLSYNANGGSGAPSSQSGSTNYTISSTVPTRTGYAFLGWSTSSSATSATYQPGSSIAISSNTTLYAVWKISDTALTVNSSNNAVISTAGEKKYYTFTPSATGTYVIYSTGSSDTKVYLYNSSGGELTSNDDGGTGGNFRLQYNLTAGTTYRFAVGYYSSSATGTIPFKFGKVYTVTYNSNGGSSAPSSQTKDYGISLTLSSSIPTRTDYTFLGWSTSSSATSPTYSAGGTYSSESNATLYAVWKVNPKATYTVTYNANGGNVTPSSTSVTEGNSVTLPTPTKSYTLSFNANGGSGAPSAQTVSVGCNGWSTSSVASSGTFSCNATVYPTANTTFYAVWNSSASKVIPSTVPTRSGYNFIGWSRSSLATTATWKAGDAITVTDNTTLYAVWQKIETPTPPPAPKVEYKSVYLDYKSTYSIDVEGFEATEYIAEDDSIISVDSNGRVTAKRPGTADVYVYDANSDVRVVYTFSVDYAWWQWIILIVLFGWIWY